MDPEPNIVEEMLAHFERRAIRPSDSPEVRRRLLMAYLVGLQCGVEACRGDQGLIGASIVMDEIGIGAEKQIARLK